MYIHVYIVSHATDDINRDNPYNVPQSTVAVAIGYGQHGSTRLSIVGHVVQFIHRTCDQGGGVKEVKGRGVKEVRGGGGMEVRG